MIKENEINVEFQKTEASSTNPPIFMLTGTGSENVYIEDNSFTFSKDSYIDYSASTNPWFYQQSTSLQELRIERNIINVTNPDHPFYYGYLKNGNVVKAVFKDNYWSGFERYSLIYGSTTNWIIIEEHVENIVNYFYHYSTIGSLHIKNSKITSSGDLFTFLGDTQVISNIYLIDSEINGNMDFEVRNTISINNVYGLDAQNQYTWDLIGTGTVNNWENQEVDNTDSLIEDRNYNDDSRYYFESTNPHFRERYPNYNRSETVPTMKLIFPRAGINSQVFVDLKSETLEAEIPIINDFKEWIGDVGHIKNIYEGKTNLLMPKKDIIVNATYTFDNVSSDVGSKVYSSNDEVDLEEMLIIIGCSIICS